MKGKSVVFFVIFLIVTVMFLDAQETEKFVIRYNSEKTIFTIRNPDNESYELILRVKYRASSYNWRETNTTDVKIKLEPKSVFTSDSPEWRSVFSMSYFDRYVDIIVIDWV